MKKIIAGVILLLATATATHAFVGETDKGENRKWGATSLNIPEEMKINAFTLKITQSAISKQEDKSDNIILSPYNIYTNLMLAGSGATGATYDEFASALLQNDDLAKDASPRLKQLNDTILNANKGHVDLLTANGIWVNKNVATLSEGYISGAKSNFGAEISTEDFADRATVGKINNWASENTKGLITKVIQQLNPDDAIVLASALYFKGKWVMPFDKKLTDEKNFTADGGATFKTPMMHQEYEHAGDIRAMSNEAYEAVSLTYGTEDAQTMRLVLLRPNDARVSARDWLATQGDMGITEWLTDASYERAMGTVELPHLDIKQHHDLVPVLENMSIKTAFTGQADFRHIVDAKSQPLFISSVSHDIVFKTDEEGSEAAAVTTMTMAGSAMAPAPPKTVNIKFDRSFVFALQDVQTGTVLFIGAVNKPNEKMTPQ